MNGYYGRNFGENFLRNIVNISARETARIGLDKPVKAKRTKKHDIANELPVRIPKIDLTARYRSVTDLGQWTNILEGNIPVDARITFTLASGRTISASVKALFALLNEAV